MTTANDFDPYQDLAAYAPQLNEVSHPRLFARPFYNLMSGALIWRDETRRDTPTHIIWALRPLWAYRTSLILGRPRRELEKWWQFGLVHFPRWVGFREERRQPAPALLRIYRRRDVTLRECLRDMEWEP